MSEPQIMGPGQKTDARPAKKQRALNALVFLLATAVCVQGYVLWDTNERLNATAAELESVKQLASGSDWKVIPRDDPNGAVDRINNPQAPSGFSAPADPFSDPVAQVDPNDWNPVAEIERMRQEMDRMMGRTRSPNAIAPQVGNYPPGFSGVHTITQDSQGDSHIIKAYIPNADASDINVHVENQLLTISVKHKHDIGGKQGQSATRQRRMSGSVSQRFTLPEPVDGARMTTSFKDGMLTIAIPKAGRANKGTNSDPSQSVHD